MGVGWALGHSCRPRTGRMGLRATQAEAHPKSARGRRPGRTRSSALVACAKAIRFAVGVVRGLAGGRRGGGGAPDRCGWAGGCPVTDGPMWLAFNPPAALARHVSGGGRERHFSLSPPQIAKHKPFNAARQVVDDRRAEVRGQRKPSNDPRNNQLVRQLLCTTNAQTAPAANSTAPVHERLGFANAETTPAGAQAAAADKTQRSDAAREGKNG